MSIAIKAGLNPQSISSAIYLNTRLKASTVIRICDALGVTAEDTELFLIMKICEELGLNLNYAVYGKERNKRNANSYDDQKEYAMTTTDRKELIHRINNAPTAALIDMLSYLPQNPKIMNTIKQDVVSHFKT